MGINSVLAALASAAILTPQMEAQFGEFRNLGHTPQAQTQEEFDRYLAIVAATSAPERTLLTRRFLSEYSESALRAGAYEYQLLACQELNDLECMLQAADRILPLLPNNLTTLVTLALAIPNGTAGRADANALLTRAEDNARRALDVLERKQIPRQIAYREWKRYRSSLQSQAHEALGHVAMKRGRTLQAIEEFETAARLESEPEGRIYFRLGVAYASDGRTSRAREALRRAAELGPPLIRQLALQELKKLAPENDKQ